jgi:HlyD family secretion protein
VRDVAGHAPWVLALVNGVVERRAVRLGLRGDAFVEIVSGVREGELVIPAGSGSPAPGTKLTPLASGA